MKLNESIYINCDGQEETDKLLKYMFCVCVEVAAPFAYFFFKTKPKTCHYVLFSFGRIDFPIYIHIFVLQPHKKREKDGERRKREWKIYACVLERENETPQSARI